MRSVRHWIPILLSIAACTGPETMSSFDAVRLIELGDRVEIDWPDAAESGPPIDLRTAVIGALEPEEAVVEVHMLGAPGVRDTRVALLAPTPSTYTFELRLPEAALMRTALGYLLTPKRPTPEPRTPEALNPEIPSVSLDFSIQIETSVGATTLLEATIETTSEGGWEEIEIDLDDWSGQEVQITFRAESPAAGLNWAAWAAPVITSEVVEPDGWDVILISLDTLRADHLGSYGYERPTSPSLDALASGGVRFATAVAHSPWTRPSHRAMFNGLYPISKAGLSAPPIAYELWRHGYRTGAITGGGQVDARFGFQTGFEVYKVDFWLHSIDQAVSWLEEGRHRKDFLFLHTFEIHDPYTDTRFTAGLDGGRIARKYADKFWERDNWMRRKTRPNERVYAEALYDGGIAFTDERLGMVFAQLEERGLLETTIVIVTSDHGEQFWEHGGWRHGSNMYDHQLLVPLIVHLPDPLMNELGLDAETVIDQQVQLIDLYPTILDLLGLPLEHQVQGISLRSLLEGRSLEPRRALAEHTTVRSHERKAIRTDKYKFVYSYPKRADAGLETYYELFDLEQDPAEQINIADQFPDFVEAQLEYIRSLRLEGGDELLEEAVPEELDADLVERLKALGYVDN